LSPSFPPLVNFDTIKIFFFYLVVAGFSLRKGTQQVVAGFSLRKGTQQVVAGFSLRFLCINLLLRNLKVAATLISLR